MTLKKLFEKVEAYNEIAEMMNSRKAKISLYDYGCYNGTSFSSYDELRKHVRREYIKEVANGILKSDAWEIDGEITVEWTDWCGSNSERFSTDLVAD